MTRSPLTPDRAMARPDRRLIILLGLFLLLLLPVAAELSPQEPDERHYADGAVKMLRDGDWLTPQTAAGEARVRKPILGYWLVGGSFALFGVEPFAARLPFLLAGCAVGWMTWRIGLIILGRRGGALLAAAIVLCQFHFAYVATRAMPDALLTCFMTMAALGFVRLLFEPQRAATSAMLAYLGIGLGVATKGLLPVVFVLFVWLYAWWRGRSLPRDQRPLPRLMHPPAIALGLIVGGWWFLVMGLMHGSLMTDDFLSDQVTDKVRLGSLKPLAAMPRLAIVFGLGFVPWLLIGLLAGGAGRARTTATKSQTPDNERWRRFTRFTLLWTALLVVIFGSGVRPAARYLLPAAPLIAVMLAGWLERLDPGRLRDAARGVGHAAIGTLAGIGLVMALANVQVGQSLPAFMLALVGLGGAATLLWTMRQRRLTAPEALCLAILATYPLVFVGIRAVNTPDQARLIAEHFEEMGLDAHTPVLYFGKPSIAGRLRMAGGGQYQIIAAPSRRTEHEAFDVVIVRREAGRGQPLTIARLEQQGYEVIEVRAGIDDLPAWPLIRAFLRWDLKRFIEEHREEHLIALRAG